MTLGAAMPAAATTALLDRLSLRGASKSYGGIHALVEVDFDVPPGQIHALVSDSGAGESTLVRVITRLVEPDGGEMALPPLWEPIPLAYPQHRGQTGE